MREMNVILDNHPALSPASIDLISDVFFSKNHLTLTYLYNNRQVTTIDCSYRYHKKHIFQYTQYA